MSEDPGRDEANLPTPAPGTRLEALGRAARKKPLVLRELTPKMRLLATYMVSGCDQDFVRKLTRPAQEVDPGTGAIVTVQRPIEPGTPLTLEEAADLLRIRRRNARDLMRQSVFAHHLSQEIAGLRNGEKAASVHRLVELRDSPGAGTAADKRVQLQAAQAILGEGEGNRPSVNVIVNNTAPIMPGYVIRLRDRDEREPKTIEGQAVRGDTAKGSTDG